MTARPYGRRGPRHPAWARVAAGIAALLTGLLAAGVALAPAASAHAVLVSSSPLDGSRVNTEPPDVRLTFDEPVGLIPADEEVISVTGLRADTGQARLAGGGTTIVLPLRPRLPPGTYSATWRVVSADTHVVTGSITFGLGVDPGAGVTAPADRSGPLDAAADIAQGLVYGGLVLLAGVLAAAWLLWPWARGHRRVHSLAWTGWAALLAGTAAELLLEGPRAANAGWAGVAGLRDAGLTLGSAYGAELLARAGLLLAVSALLLAWSRRGQRAAIGLVPGRVTTSAAAATGVAILASVAVTGHASAGPDAWLALCAAMVHLAAMSLWLGGLLLLGAVVLPGIRRGDRTLAEAGLRRWSLTAYGCVTALVISGEYQAARQVSPLPALWSTSYGITLLVKAGLIALMLAAAFGAHRAIMSQGTPEGIPPAIARAVRRSVRCEAALAAGVLAVTAVLVSEPPARTSYGPPAIMAAPLGPAHLAVTVAATRRGPQDITIRILNGAGAPVPAQSVTGSLSSASVAALNLTLRRAAPDGSRWTTAGAVAPLPGTWTITLNVALNATSAYTTSASYQVW